MGNPREGADASQLWRRLAENGDLAALYRSGNPRAGVVPVRLRDLLRRLDAEESIGATLGVCVQATTSLPLLAEAARQAASPQHPLALLLRGVLAGRNHLALAATDETAGSDLVTLRTRLVLGPEYCRLSGTKQWVSNAVHATHLLVLARHRDGTEFTNFTWVVVPADYPGVRVEPAAAALFAGSGTGHVTFDDVCLPRDHVVRPGRGLVDFVLHVSVERLASAVWGHAMCRRVLRETVDHLRCRDTGAGNLWDREEIRRRVGASLLATAQLDALTRRHEGPITEKHDHVAAAMVKAAAAQTVEEVLATCAHLQGARAFADGGLQTLRAQAALWGIGGGTYEVMLATIADQVDRLLVPAA